MVKHNIKIEYAENGQLIIIRWRKDGKPQVKAKVFEGEKHDERSQTWMEFVIKQNNEG